MSVALGTTLFADRRNGMSTLSPLELDTLLDNFVKPLTKEERKRQLLHRIKSMRAELVSVERELARVDLGLPEPYKIGNDVPDWLRRKDEAGA
jgi:hypothetical protein